MALITTPPVLSHRFGGDLLEETGGKVERWNCLGSSRRFGGGVIGGKVERRNWLGSSRGFQSTISTSKLAPAKTTSLHHFGDPDTDTDAFSISIIKSMKEKYGLFVWPCSTILAEYVWQQRLRFLRASVVELQELASQLIDLWNLMETPEDERSLFDHVTCNISASDDEVTIPGALALDLIEQAEVEVERLDQLKSCKMKEIAFRRQAELEEIFARAHIEIDSDGARDRIVTLIDFGSVEPSELLVDMESHITKAKEEAFSRKDILDKVERWMSACEEESWLEDYNKDDNRYNSSRGAHLNLKRDEKVHILVNKIPALVDSLIAKTQAWEEDRGVPFTYDGVPLLAMLDEYVMLRQDREEEKRRQQKWDLFEKEDC